MMRAFLAFCLCLCFFSEKATSQIKRIHLHGTAQGTTWQVIYYSSDSIVHQQQIDSLLLKIDSVLSIYKAYSQIVSFNNSARGIRADSHFIKVVNRAIEVSKASGGLFDITIAPLVNAWGFGAKGKTEIPDQQQIDSLLKCSGYKKIEIKKDSIIKIKPCFQIDVNGIAQGYSVDAVAELLEKSGVENYLVEIGGELRVRGRKQPSGEKFSIGIESPEEPEDDYQLSLQKTLLLDDGAVTTSGNYRKYIERGGHRLSHVIDPRNGRPVENNIISVTVFANDATTADAYDNALMLMGLKKAVRFLNKHPELNAHFIYKNRKGKIKSVFKRK